ncbi:MAG TPA: 3-oxoacyl-ACP reductase family protein [Methylomirabilota bacterium]
MRTPKPASRPPLQPSLAGRVALVTGGGRGFGRAIALALGRAGADVAVNYNASRDHAADVACALENDGRRAVALKADVASDDEVRSLVSAVLERFGRLDILVNNAGVMVHGAFHEILPERYDAMFAVNVGGTMRCTYHALPAMMEKKHGRIINLSSQLAQRGVATSGFAAYAATKGAIESFTRAIAHECGRYGVTANAIAPGGIETDMSRGVMTEEYRTRRLQELPLRRFGGVEDVAYCAVFLAADEASYLTGQILHPSGGWVMG